MYQLKKSKYVDTYQLIFSSLIFQQMLLPLNIRLQLDFHIVDQIKEIPGKIRQLRDIFQMYFWCTGLQIFSEKFSKYLSKSKCDFCICLYIDTSHTYLILYF